MTENSSLVIYHLIHLTAEERAFLHQGNDVETVGITVPVWVIDKKTSEPASEIFSKYILKNPRKEIPIKFLPEGFEIVIPYRKGTKLTISDDEWRFLNMNDKQKLDALYRSTVSEISSENLVDIQEGFISYREHNKLMFNDKPIAVKHYISIESKEKLLRSIELSRTFSQFHADSHSNIVASS